MSSTRSASSGSQRRARPQPPDVREHARPPRCGRAERQGERVDGRGDLGGRPVNDGHAVSPSTVTTAGGRPARRKVLQQARCFRRPRRGREQRGQALGAEAVARLVGARAGPPRAARSGVHAARAGGRRRRRGSRAARCPACPMWSGRPPWERLPPRRRGSSPCRPPSRAPRSAAAARRGRYQRATWTFAGSAPRPSSSGSRPPPVLISTSTGSPARPRTAARSRRGSPEASVLSATCTHGRSVRMPASAAAVSRGVGGYQMQLPT